MITRTTTSRSLTKNVLVQVSPSSSSSLVLVLLLLLAFITTTPSTPTTTTEAFSPIVIDTTAATTSRRKRRIMERTRTTRTTTTATSTKSPLVTSMRPQVVALSSSSRTATSTTEDTVLSSSSSSSSSTITTSNNNNNNKAVVIDDDDDDDTTTLGTLQVPTVGIGTISWSSDNLLYMENRSLQQLVNKAIDITNNNSNNKKGNHNNNNKKTNDGFLLDTAERYGSHYKTALGIGWGETEELTKLLLQRATTTLSSNNSINIKNDGGGGDAPSGGAAAVIATKFTPTPWRTTKESVVEACIQSCQRLGVEQIDLYQLHMPDIVQPMRKLTQGYHSMGMNGGMNNIGVHIKDEIYWDGIAECYHLGLIKNVGVCNYGPTLLMRCQDVLGKRNVPLVSNQIAYSLMGRHNGSQETVDRCHELGIKVMAYFPFAMGLLTGKYTNNNNSNQNRRGRRRSTATTTTTTTGDGKIILSDSLINSKKTFLEELDLRRYADGGVGNDSRNNNNIPNGGIKPLLDVMEEIAIRRNKSISQVALNYIICKDVIPIPGSRTVDQFMDNIDSMGWRLTSDEITLLEETSDALGFGFNGAGFKRTNEKFVGYGIEKWTLD